MYRAESETFPFLETLLCNLNRILHSTSPVKASIQRAALRCKFFPSAASAESSKTSIESLLVWRVNLIAVLHEVCSLSSILLMEKKNQKCFQS